MQKRKQSGFTLVELVVVIAVLAILAGVGAVAYNGYIEKANEAHDLALLSAVNTAFQAACTEEEISEYPTADDRLVAAELTGDKGALKLSAVTFNGYDDFFEVFKKYYDGNEDAVFKVYTKLEYGKDEPGTFVGVLADGTMVTAGGKKITINKNEDGTSTYTFEKDGKTWSYKVNDADLETYKAAIGQNIGVDELMSALDTCGVAAEAQFSALLSNKVQRTNTLGAEANAAFEKYLNDNGIPDDSSDPRYKKAISNAVIMTVANWTKEKSAEDIIGIVNGTKHMGTGVAMMIGDAATSFGVLTVWAQDPEYKDRVLENADGLTAEAYWKKLSNQLASGDPDQVNTAKLDIIKLGNKIKGNSFDDYCSSESGKKAIEGYVAALRTLDNNNTTLKDADGNNIYENGFADEDLVDMLMAVFG